MLVLIACFSLGISLVMLIGHTDGWSSNLGIAARLLSGISATLLFPVGLIAALRPIDDVALRTIMMGAALSSSLTSWMINGWKNRLGDIIWSKVFAVLSAMFVVFAAIYR